MAKTLTVFLAADLRRFNGGMRDAQRTTQGFGGTLKNSLGPALVAATAAAGAFAIKLAKDGVQAAIDDERAVAQLARTLQTLNLAHDTQAVEDYVRSLERAFGVSDLELRPAYERLVRSTKNTEDANRSLRLAMDISAGTGKSLQTVTDALGRAYDGNLTSLQRLGLGIDRTELASMSLDQVLDRLSSNFRGAADVAANTFEGRMQRLRTATDNLAEAFGTGLLGGLKDATEGTQDLVDVMGDLEPFLESIGSEVGELGADIGFLAGLFTDLAANINDSKGALGDFGPMLGNVASIAKRAINPLSGLIDIFRNFRRENSKLNGGEDVRDSFPALRNNVQGVSASVRDANANYQDAALRARRLATEVSNLSSATTSSTAATRGGSKATEEYTKKQQRLIDLAKIQGSVLATTQKELIDQIGVLEKATKAVEDYANAIQQDLLRGFDLGGLFEGSLDEQGQFSADRFFASFDDAINKAEWFGGVLQALKSRNVDQRLIEQIASLGPDVGGKLAEEMLTGDGAMVQSLVDRWTRIQDTTRELALGLVPEFLTAGRESAIDTLNGLAEQFRKDQRKFANLGRRLGQQVGVEFKKQIAKDVADAVRAVEAAATAARAEAVARAEAQQARVTEQAVATAIANLIRNSDQRTGRNVTPVLA